MSTYETGTVAMVTALNRSTPYRAFFDGRTWREMDVLAAFCVDTPTSIRPLVVLDLGEFEGRPVVETLCEAQTLVAVDGHNTAALLIESIRDQIEQQTKPPFIPRFALGSHVRFTGSPTESAAEAWTIRRTEKHRGIVVENYGDGEVRVYDTVEHDWWQCDETRLAAFEDGGS